MNWIARQFALKHLNKLLTAEHTVESTSLAQANRLMVFLPFDEDKRNAALIWLEHLKTDFDIPIINTCYYKDRKPGKEEAVSENQMNRRHLNWYRKPTDDHFKKVFATHHDLLIVLEPEPKLPLKMAIAMANVKLKVGIGEKHMAEFYDFHLKTEGTESMEFVGEQIEKYLSIFDQAKPAHHE